MRKYLRRLAPIGALVAAAVVALSATPAFATEVCQSGHTPPSPYCQNVPPTAQTGNASNVKSGSATLNGTAGAGVTGGDPTTWFFEYGTSTAYGHQTTPQTLGACPSGTTAPSPYCTTPASQPVSSHVSGLAACTTYDYQLVAQNSDSNGKPTLGGNKTFTTGPGGMKIKVPRKVKSHHKFKVKVTLTTRASITIFIIKNHRIVKTYREGSRGPGHHSFRIRAPRKTGRYKVTVRATESCGRTFGVRHIRVTGKKHHHHH